MLLSAQPPYFDLERIVADENGDVYSFSLSAVKKRRPSIDAVQAWKHKKCALAGISDIPYQPFS